MQGFKFEQALKLLIKHFPETPMKKPTLYHSIRVGVYLWSNGYSEDLQIAGLLHDSLEDTDIPEDLISELFGQKILDIVKANSKSKDVPKDHILEDIINRCISCSQDALIVKMADIYDNYLFYKSENMFSEIDRCKYLVNLIKIHKPSSYRDKIWEKISEI